MAKNLCSTSIIVNDATKAFKGFFVRRLKKLTTIGKFLMPIPKMSFRSLFTGIRVVDFKLPN